MVAYLGDAQIAHVGEGKEQSQLHADAAAEAAGNITSGEAEEQRFEETKKNIIANLSSIDGLLVTGNGFGGYSGKWTMHISIQAHSTEHHCRYALFTLSVISDYGSYYKFHPLDDEVVKAFMAALHRGASSAQVDRGNSLGTSRCTDKEHSQCIVRVSKPFHFQGSTKRMALLRSCCLGSC